MTRPSTPRSEHVANHIAKECDENPNNNIQDIHISTCVEIDKLNKRNPLVVGGNNASIQIAAPTRKQVANAVLKHNRDQFLAAFEAEKLRNPYILLSKAGIEEFIEDYNDKQHPNKGQIDKVKVAEALYKEHGNNPMRGFQMA